MSDWDPRREHFDANQDKRGRREPQDRNRAFGPGPRVAADERSWREERAPRGDAQRGGGRSAYEGEVGPYSPGGDPARGYGEGGDSAYGQMSRGSSDTSGGGYGGANVGGYGQSGLSSQWGAGGYGRLNTGLDYGEDGARFGPQGYAEGDFGRRSQPGRPNDRPAHDTHEASYHHWRDTQLSSHDRDYARWRDEQVKRYDEDYHGWRNERHSAFSKEFEGWRTGRGGQAGATPADARASSYTTSASTQTDGVHGANPTLGNIADGHAGHREHRHDDPAASDKDLKKN